MSYIAVVLRLNMSTYHAFKCFCNLVYQSDILFANYCFDTRRVTSGLMVDKQFLHHFQPPGDEKIP